jgi:hypothetical protein
MTPEQALQSIGKGGYWRNRAKPSLPRWYCLVKEVMLGGKYVRVSLSGRMADRWVPCEDVTLHSQELG